MGRKRQEKMEQPEVDEQQNAAAEGAEVDAVGDDLDSADAAGLFEADSRTAELEQQLNEWKDRCLRQAAEADNLRRRTLREAEDAKRFANERLVSDLLPVLDNFGRALEAAGQTDNFDALKGGVEQIYRLLDDILCRAGLQRIEAAGQPFDPNLHEAIMQVPADEEHEPGYVVEELRPGYRLNDRVVRPSLVKVTTS